MLQLMAMIKECTALLSMSQRREYCKFREMPVINNKPALCREKPCNGGLSNEDGIEILRRHDLNKKREEDYMTVWSLLTSGSKVNIDLVKKDMKVNGRHIIKEGEVVAKGYVIEKAPKADLKEVLKTIEYLYSKYAKSLPSQKEKDSRYFKAFKFEELTDAEAMMGWDRRKAKAILEGYVLRMVLEGKLYWDDGVMKGTWFWQSQRYPDLVLLKDWM